ncbi:hypothetical protein AB3X52_15715 [Nocardioides sp. DS6]|uniref:Antitoxin VbhA domain-containing protein n=1 Tax=Nocardioides eburneus TaxID=3231482 RepID=A0ABV3T1Q2_9ACTN
MTEQDDVPVTTVGRTIRDCMAAGTDPAQLRKALDQATADGTLRTREAAELTAAVDRRGPEERSRA